MNCGGAAVRGLVATTLLLPAVQFGSPGAGSLIDPAVLAQGAHRVHVLDTPKHLAYACATCHHDGGAAVTLEGWEPATKGCGTSYCHGRFSGGAGAAARWTSPSTLTCAACHGFPPATGAHARHASKDQYAIGCVVCHGGDDWVNHHTAGEVRIAFASRAGAAASYAAPTCSAVACHSNGLGLSRPAAWDERALQCSSCHDDETTAEPRMSGQHLRHLRVGLGCADCHRDVVDGDKRIVDYSLHANGRADVRLLSGHYSAGSCQPACHEQRTW